MPENRLARSLDGLLAQADAIRLADANLWSGLNLKHNSPEHLAAAMATVRSAENRFHAARSAQRQATAARTRVDHAAWDFITAARTLLGHHLGRQYSEKWAPLGFPGYSLRIPQRRDQRAALLANLAAYFRAHPEHEIPGYATADRAARFHADLVAATAQFNHCRVATRTALNERDRAVTALRKRIRFLTVELRLVTGQNDPRWLDFGLNIPATTRRRRTATAEPPATTPQSPVIDTPLRTTPEPLAGTAAVQTAAPAPMTVPCHTGTERPMELVPAFTSRPRTARKRSWLTSLIPSWN